MMRIRILCEPIMISNQSTQRWMQGLFGANHKHAPLAWVLQMLFIIVSNFFNFS
jgi:hypothetical protein